MHYLSESHLFLFLVQVLILLGLARTLGTLLQRFGQPAITAEILVGIVLGPTVFGRLAPGAFRAVFPADPMQQNMIETVGWLGILFFLLDAGLETDLPAALRQRSKAMIISASDLVIPMALVIGPCFLLPDAYLADPGSRVLFALFVATIMTISALPVTARVLQDLHAYRTDTGHLIMGALTINDVAGWIVFAVILGFATEEGMELGQVPLVVGTTLAFAALFLTAGKYLTDGAIAAFHRWNLPEPGTSLTFICLLGLLGGAITLTIGIHALFGFFIAGIMAGASESLTHRTRQVIAEMVRAVLVPLFFVSIGLKLDFLAHFNLFLVAFFTFLGVGGRFLGAWVGSLLAGKGGPERHVIAAAHTPGGEMQIVIGLLALEYGVVTQQVFVAITVGAIISSVALGPWLKHAHERMKAAAAQGV